MAEPAATENAAWVDIELPLAPQQALGYARNIERLLRLNPTLRSPASKSKPTAATASKDSTK